MNKMRTARLFNRIIKIAFFGLLIFSLVMRQAPQFHGKGMLVRVLAYPLAALIVPWFWRAYLNRGSYPELADACILLPFVVDLFGNAAFLYDSIPHFDDAAHFVNWFFLMTGVALLLSRFKLNRMNRATIIIGIGAISAILWEVAEYVVMKTGASHLFLTYEDTIGDLTLGLGGAILAVIVTAFQRIPGRHNT